MEKFICTSKSKVISQFSKEITEKNSFEYILVQPGCSVVKIELNLTLFFLYQMSDFYKNCLPLIFYNH